MARIFRVVVPESDIERGAAFYAGLFEMAGERVSPGRHYFDLEGVILAVVDPRADGQHQASPRPNPDYVYVAVDDLDAMFARAETLDPPWVEDEVATRPWGERSFYLHDPFGNPICFVDAVTAYRGGDWGPGYPREDSG